MKVKVIKAFRDKMTMSILRPEQIIEVSEERFGELTGPHGIFVEEIQEELTLPPITDEDPEDKKLVEPPKEEKPLVEHKEEILTLPDFEKMNKTEIIEYAKGLNIELNMEMTRAEMMELLEK